MCFLFKTKQILTASGGLVGTFTALVFESAGKVTIVYLYMYNLYWYKFYTVVTKCLLFHKLQFIVIHLFEKMGHICWEKFE